MTSRERMMSAYRCEEPDIFPIYIRGVPAWDAQWCESKHESYRPIIEAVREHGAYVGGFGLDPGLYQSAAKMPQSVERTDLGDWMLHRATLATPKGPLYTTHKTSRRGLPGLQIEYPVKTLEDVERVLSVPYEPLRLDVSKFFEADRRMGDAGIVMCGVRVPIATVGRLTGSELFAIWSVTHRDVLSHLTEVFLERTLDSIDWLISEGVGPIFASSGEEYLTPPLAGPNDFREFVVKPGLQIRDRLQRAGMLRHIHCHGPISAILEDFLEMGTNCLHPVEPPPLGDVTFGEAKRRIGDRVCLEGNVQIGDLYSDPTDVLVEKVRNTCEVGAPGGGFVLCPTASPHTAVLTDLTVRNYLAMIETAVEIRGE